MARPQKKNADYFSHDAHHGKTIFILESRWGNDGYAVWYKILERLTASDNHCINCNNRSDVMHLSAYCRISESTLMEILEFLAEVSAIHQGFWRQKYIYSPNLVERLSGAYRNRINSLPTIDKVSSELNIYIKEFPAQETPNKDESDVTNRERKGKEIKEKEKETSFAENDFPKTENRTPLKHEKIVFDQMTGQFSGINGQRDIWLTAYPAISIDTELAKAAAWLIANPSNVKKNYARFLTNWLSRAQEKAPTKQQVPAKAPLPIQCSKGAEYALRRSIELAEQQGKGGSFLELSA